MAKAIDPATTSVRPRTRAIPQTDSSANPRAREAVFSREFAAGLVLVLPRPARERWSHAPYAVVRGFRSDAIFALRQLRSAPAFTVVAALTLALGIGANGAIFALVDAALLRPLEFRDPEQLVKVWERSPRRRARRPRLSTLPTGSSGREPSTPLAATPAVWARW